MYPTQPAQSPPTGIDPATYPASIKYPTTLHPPPLFIFTLSLMYPTQPAQSPPTGIDPATYPASIKYPTTLHPPPLFIFTLSLMYPTQPAQSPPTGIDPATYPASIKYPTTTLHPTPIYLHSKPHVPHSTSSKPTNRDRSCNLSCLNLVSHHHITSLLFHLSSL